MDRNLKTILIVIAVIFLLVVVFRLFSAWMTLSIVEGIFERVFEFASSASR